MIGSFWRSPKVTLPILAGMVWILGGCASTQTEKQLDEKISQEPALNQADLAKETKTQIDTATGITENQRTQLTELRRATNRQTKEISEESLKLRSVLVKELISPNYDADMVSLIEKKLRKLEDKRLSVIFNAVEKVNDILGRQAQLREPVVRDFLAPRG
jgi:uncharacterized membrane protein